MNENEFKTLLGLAIRAERKRQKLTQEQLGGLINLDFNNLSRIEKGKNFPSFETFCKLVMALHISPNDLLSFMPFDGKEKSVPEFEFFNNFNTLPENLKNNIKDLVNNLKRK